jgi:hypothetical protein
MKIRPLVLWAIKGNPDLRFKVRNALGISNPTMTRLLQSNSDDLTKASSLEVLREELKLTNEEILENSEITETQT